MDAKLEARRAQMFPAMTDAQVARIAHHATEKRFAAGALVWEQGDATVPFYVVLDGELEVVHPRKGGEDQVVVHHRHEFTGEANMLAGRRSLVCGRAKTDLHVLAFEQSRLRSIIQTDAELGELIMRAFILRRVALLSESFGDAVIIGSRNSAATLHLQEFLHRNGHPYQCVDADTTPDIQTLLDEFHVGVDDIPILICRGTLVLKHPTDAEVAECLGFNPALGEAMCDIVICGAGPGGLAAAVYGASEGLDVLIVESRSPGGQAASSSKIENYLGFPTGVSGEALAARAMAQAEKFGARLVVARGAKRLWCDETPMRVELENGESMRTRAIVIATGVEYRKLEVPDLARFEGNGVYYAATSMEAQRCEKEDVIVVGGGNSAGQAATFLSRSSRHVHVLIRGPDLAESMSRYLIRRIEETPNITLHRRTSIVELEGTSHLERVTWHDANENETSTHSIRHVFSMAGAKPNTEWLRGCVDLDDKGFVITGNDLGPNVPWSLPRRPYLFETSKPRVFAVGDVRSGSVKRVASAVGEGSVCVQLVHKVLGE